MTSILIDSLVKDRLLSLLVSARNRLKNQNRHNRTIISISFILIGKLTLREEGGNNEFRFYMSFFL